MRNFNYCFILVISLVFCNKFCLFHSLIQMLIHQICIAFCLFKTNPTVKRFCSPKDKSLTNLFIRCSKEKAFVNALNCSLRLL